MNKIRELLFKHIKILFLIFSFTVTIFFLSLVAVSLLPNQPIAAHVQESIELLESEGLYPQSAYDSFDTYLSINLLDNFTDALMMNIAVSMDSEQPIISAIAGYHGYSQDLNQIEMLSATVNDEQEYDKQYVRYWHGQQVFLRPLLLFLNYGEIRSLNYIMMTAILFYTLVLLAKKLGRKYAIAFFIAIMSSNFAVVPLSLQFSPMYYIAFISVIVILKFDTKIKDIYLFFIIGIIANFMDFLTFPLITLGVPLVVLYILKLQNNITRPIVVIFRNSAMWTLGYALCWVGKWTISSVILQENVFLNYALPAIFNRSSDSVSGNSITYFGVLYRNIAAYTDISYKMLINNQFVKCVAFFLLLYILLFLLFRKKHAKKKILWLGVVAFYPLIWFAVLQNHSYVHCWFTARILMISIFAVLSMMANLIDVNRVTDKCKNFKTMLLIRISRS